jgi:hypothetical protein
MSNSGKLKMALLALTIQLSSTLCFPQTDFFHENLYDFLRKDITSLKKEIRKKNVLKLESKTKDNRDSMRLVYQHKGHDVFYTFFILNDTCVYIAAQDFTATPETAIATFRTKYNEVTEEDQPGFLEGRNTKDYQFEAIFEDNSRNVAYYMCRDLKEPEGNVFYFYSMFMKETLWP